MNSIDITGLIGLGGLLSHIFILVIVVGLLFGKNFKLIGKYGIYLAFLTALTAMLSSLYYSEVVGFLPCTLCWYQRIFSYATVFILGLSIIKKDNSIIPYGIFLSFLGGIIALYHSYIQISHTESVVCGESAVSCGEMYFTLYGYITIPILSLTTFVLTILFLHLKDIYVKSNTLSS